jgi:hypothetical protein
MPQQGVRDLVAQYYSQTGLVPRHGKYPCVHCHLATGDGKGVHHIRIINDAKLPILVGFAGGARDALAYLPHDPFRLAMMGYHAVTENVTIRFFAEARFLPLGHKQELAPSRVGSRRAAKQGQASTKRRE